MTAAKTGPSVEGDPTPLQRPEIAARLGAQPLPAGSHGDVLGRGAGERPRTRNPAEIAVMQKLSVQRGAVPARRRERLDRQLVLPFLELSVRRAEPPDWPASR